MTPEFDLIADEVKFDTVELHKFWGGRRYLPFLKSYPGYTDINHIGFDTINLIKTFIIKTNEKFPLETGTTKPDLALFETITIINCDTLVLENKVKIQEAFKLVDKRVWELVVK